MASASMDPEASPNVRESRPVDRGGIAAWCSFDWANSPFPTLIVTFVFATYFANAVAVDKTTGLSQWAWALGISAFVVAVLGPLLGAIADRGGNGRKGWIGFFSLCTVLATAGLWFVTPEPGSILLALGLVIVANAAFEFGMTFYNAMLPDLVPERWVGRVSGWSWGLGYFAGLVALILFLTVFILPAQPPFGLDKETAEPVRAVGILVALWYGLFSLIFFLRTPDIKAPKDQRLGARLAIRAGWAHLRHRLAHARHYPNMVRFLLARLFYNDGLLTLFAMGSVYAVSRFAAEAGTIESFGTVLKVSEWVLWFGIGMNITAGLGAFVLAQLDDWLGPKAVILLSLGGMLVLGSVILLTPSVEIFLIGSLILGLFIGPVQASSRSLMVRLTHEDDRAEMFGLYALSGKITSFIGPFLVGLVSTQTGNEQLGMGMIVLLILAGTLILLPLRPQPDPKEA